MKQEKIIPLDVESRVNTAIHKAMNLYINKLINNSLELYLEASFQLHYARILEDVLKLYTLSNDERFKILLECKFKTDDDNKTKYVDIVIKYTKDCYSSYYLIELKYKKITDSAPDLGNLHSYIDMYNLDELSKQKDINGAYFIFLTNLKTYINEPRKGIRKELPMHDNSEIKANNHYKANGKAVSKEMEKFPNGFIFSKSHTIEYTNFKINAEDYWYFIEKMS